MLVDTVRSLANYGSAKKYVFRYKGRNSRLDEIQAAVLDVKLKHLDDDNILRRKVAKMYLDGITNPKVILPQVPDWNANVFHQFPIRAKERDKLQQYLKDNGVGTTIHYPIPPHRQLAFKEWNSFSFPVTERIHDEELSIPMGPVLSQEQIQYVLDIINQW
jgi:dTDP-4-amino-4,6-dideoxygalactose transaminase